MNEHGFENAPDMGRDFEESADPEFHLEHDAANWETLEEQSDKPTEKRFEMHYTPGGTLEQEVHTEIDKAARAGIREARDQEHSNYVLDDEKPLDFAGDFETARRNDRGWDPDSMREYEAYLSERTDEEWDQFLGNRFDSQRDYDQDLDH